MLSRASGRLLVLGLVLGLVPALLLASCSSGSRPVAVGVAAETTAAADAFRAAVGAPVALDAWYASWQGRPPFDAARATAIASRGALPLLTWEPWDPRGGLEQPEYALARVADGTHDAYLTSFARQVRAWGGVLALRFAHELNSRHYPWSVGVNGNTAADARAAWRHVRQVFAREGADVVWVWSANVSGPGTTPLRDVFPGDDAVDWVGLDGYNGGTALPWGGWRSPRALLGRDVRTLHALSGRPVLLTETASTEAGGSKARWVTALFRLCRDEDVDAVIWFDVDKETDWRVDSSAGSLAAFRAAVRADGGTAPRGPLPDRLVRGP